MTAPRELLDEEQLIDQQERGGRPVAAEVEWDVRDLPPKDWGTERDPWRRRIESDVLGTIELRLGITTNEVCARLSVDPTQSNRTRAAYSLRALGWRAGAQSQIAGKKLPRRYYPQRAERRSGVSAQGSDPGSVSPPAAAPPPKTSRWDPRTAPVVQKGFDGQPDWVMGPNGQAIRRPVVFEPPSARVEHLRRKRTELAQALADVDAELARLGAR